MRRITLVPLALLAIYFIAFTVAGSSGGKMGPITVERVLKISNKKAVELGYDIDSLKTSTDAMNTAWQTYNSKNIILKHNPELAAKLAGKKYFAVYYEPKEMQVGGDLWVFVETDTGDVIAYIVGE